MVDSISGNYFNKWFQQGQNYLSFGQKLVGQDSNPVQNPPVYQFGQPFAMNVGGVTGPSSVNPVHGVARTKNFGYVPTENGNLVSVGNDGVGLTLMEPGAGSHYDPVSGHAMHTKWMVG